METRRFPNPRWEAKGKRCGDGPVVCRCGGGAWRARGTCRARRERGGRRSAGVPGGRGAFLCVLTAGCCRLWRGRLANPAWAVSLGPGCGRGRRARLDAAGEKGGPGEPDARWQRSRAVWLGAKAVLRGTWGRVVKCSRGARPRAGRGVRAGAGEPFGARRRSLVWAPGAGARRAGGGGAARGHQRRLSGACLALGNTGRCGGAAGGASFRGRERDRRQWRAGGGAWGWRG
jgi:hypothetical protein